MDCHPCGPALAVLDLVVFVRRLTDLMIRALKGSAGGEYFLPVGINSLDSDKNTLVENCDGHELLTNAVFFSCLCDQTEINIAEFFGQQVRKRVRHCDSRCLPVLTVQTVQFG